MHTCIYARVHVSLWFEEREELQEKSPEDEEEDEEAAEEGEVLSRSSLLLQGVMSSFTAGCGEISSGFQECLKCALWKKGFEKSGSICV